MNNTSIRIVGHAARVPSSAGWRDALRRVRYHQRSQTATTKRGPPIAILAALLLTTACSTTGPRVLEVSSRTRLQDIDVADSREYFGYDEASRFTYVPQDLSIAHQREEFYVRWTPASISLVKFEYRQVAKPAMIFEKTYAPNGDTAKLFRVIGEEFRAGGSVSAWRVTLWKDDQLVAEKKSFALW